jgi:hypothetical protein
VQAAYKRAMRRTLLPFLLVFVALGLGWFALWWWATGRLDQGFAAWQQAATRSGWRVEAGPPRRAGWPFAAELQVPDLVLAGVGTWRDERVVLRLSPLQPQMLQVQMLGTQRVALPGAAEVLFTADRFNLAIPLATGGLPPPVALDGARLRFAAPLEGLTVGLLEGSALRRQDGGPGKPALEFQCSAEAITLPARRARQPLLGGRIASASVQGSLDGLVPDQPDPAAWRAGGGALQLRQLALGWGPFGLTGSATVTLDGALQPQGSGRVQVVGYAETLASLVSSGTITPDAAQALRAVLGLLARTPEAGGAPVVDLPVAVHDRSVTVGQIPIGKLPTLDWSLTP